MRSFRAVIIVAAIFFTLPLAAKADSVDFNTVGSGGFIWGETDLTASTAADGVTAQRIGSPSGPLYSGPLLAGSVLSFTTGAYAGASVVADMTLHSFSSGGAVTVAGCEGNCFSGTFAKSQLLFDAASGGYTFTGNYVNGVLSAALLAALGFPMSTPTSASGFITANFIPDATIGGKYHWASGDLTVAPVPEPSALALLAIGLVGIALVARKRIIHTNSFQR